MGWLKNWFLRRSPFVGTSVPLATGEAKEAIARAETVLQEALSRTDEIAEVASKLRTIEEKNHFVERIDIAWRRKEAHL